MEEQLENKRSFPEINRLSGNPGEWEDPPAVSALRGSSMFPLSFVTVLFCEPAIPASERLILTTQPQLKWTEHALS